MQVMFTSLDSISKGIIILSVENYDFSMIFEVQWKLILQAYLQVHFELIHCHKKRRDVEAEA